MCRERSISRRQSPTAFEKNKGIAGNFFRAVSLSRGNEQAERAVDEGEEERGRGFVESAAYRAAIDLSAEGCRRSRAK